MANYRDLPIAFGNNRYHQRSTVRMLFTALILISGVGGYLLYNTTTEAPPNGIPLIRAEEEPIKTKPENPGGMDVPNLGVEVLNPDKFNTAVVLGPPPEEPALLPETPTTEDVAGIIQPPPLSEPGLEINPVPTETTDLETTYRVQIASVKSEWEAKDEWKRLKLRYPILLQRLNLSVARVDLGEKGVFYRLLIGPLPNKAAANEFCLSAKNRKLACLIHTIIE
jgi:hypothetical protein